eukprot:8576002-Ditylum_brightwellii.AAC.1
MTEKSFLCNIFCALLTTTNPTFHSYIETKKDTFDEGKAVDMMMLMRDVKTKYTNLSKKKAPADPKDAKIVALTTKVENLEKKMK